MGDEQKRPKLLMWGWFKAPPGEAAPVDAFPPSFEEVPFSDEEDDDAAGTGGASPGASTDGSSSDEDAAKACSAAKGRYHRPWHNEKVKCVPVLALAGAAGLVAGGLLVHFIRRRRRQNTAAYDALDEADAEVDRMLEERYRRRRQRACMRYRHGSRDWKDEFCDTMTMDSTGRRTGRRPRWRGGGRAAAASRWTQRVDTKA